MKSPKTAVKETPKLTPELRKQIENAKEKAGRFSQMAYGIHVFCFNVDPAREEVYDFSCAIANIADMLQEDAQKLAENLGKIVEEN